MVNFLQRLLACMLGIFFMVSGFLKMMDPVGTTLIVESYLNFFHISFLRPLSPFIATAISLTESVLGAGLCTGVWRRFFAVFTFVMLGFFTLVTIFLVIFNPSMDCGCFGEAVHLTHMQSLLKNILLLLLSCAAFLPLYNLGFSARHRLAGFIGAVVMIVAFALYSMVHPPLVEFTDFKVSNTIVPDNGNYEGASDCPTLPLWDEDYNDCSAEILDGKVAAIVIYRPEKLSDYTRVRLTRFVQEAWNTEFRPVVLSTGPAGISGAEEYYSDYKTLITLSRSNGGMVLLDNGYIIVKNSVNDVIHADFLNNFSSVDSTEAYIETATAHSLLLQFYMLLLIIFTLFV